MASIQKGPTGDSSTTGAPVVTAAISLATELGITPSTRPLSHESISSPSVRQQEILRENLKMVATVLCLQELRYQSHLAAAAEYNHWYKGLSAIERAAAGEKQTFNPEAERYAAVGDIFNAQTGQPERSVRSHLELLVQRGLLKQVVDRLDSGDLAFKGVSIPAEQIPVFLELLTKNGIRTEAP